MKNPLFALLLTAACAAACSPKVTKSPDPLPETPLAKILEKRNYTIDLDQFVSNWSPDPGSIIPSGPKTPGYKAPLSASLGPIVHQGSQGAWFLRILGDSVYSYTIYDISDSYQALEISYGVGLEKIKPFAYKIGNYIVTPRRNGAFEIEITYTSHAVREFKTSRLDDVRNYPRPVEYRYRFKVRPNGEVKGRLTIGGNSVADLITGRVRLSQLPDAH